MSDFDSSEKVLDNLNPGSALKDNQSEFKYESSNFSKEAKTRLNNESSGEFQKAQVEGQGSEDEKSIIKNNSSNILIKQKDRYDNIHVAKNMFNVEDQSSNDLKLQKSSNYLNNPEILQKKNSIRLEPISSIMKSRDVKVLSSDNFLRQSRRNPMKYQKLKRPYKPKEIQNNAEFIKQFIPKHRKLIGVLKRDKGGSKKIFPQYDFFLNEELRFIMSSKRKPCFMVSTYHIGSILEPITQLEEQYCGTVRSNFSGSIWNLEDNSFEAQSRLLATVYFENQITLSFTPRSIEVYVLSPYYTYNDLSGTGNNKNLKQLYEIGDNAENKRIYKLINKKPTYNEKHSIWTLDFHGKAPISSVKNMILVDAQNQGLDVMLLTKAADNAFNLQVCYPLSPRIAMAIANSSFDFKWVCQ